MGQTFAHILKSLRNERGLSQQALADQLGIKRSTIGNYEQGTRSPDMETLEAIADYFNVDLDYLYGKTAVRNKFQLLSAKGGQGGIPETIAAHFEGKTFSDQAIDDIVRFIDFVAMKEAQENGGRP